MFETLKNAFKVKEIILGHGKPEWGHTTAAAVFIIKLGDRIYDTEDNI